MKLIYLFCLLGYVGLAYSQNSQTEAGAACIDGSTCADGQPSSLSKLAESLPQCPKFIIEQQTLRDEKGSLTASSPNEICLKGADSFNNHFKNAVELESYLQGHPSFSELHKKSSTSPLFSSCLSQGVFDTLGLGEISFQQETKILPENKKKLAVAEYYSSLKRISDGVERSLQNIASIDLMIGSPSLLKGVPCNNLENLVSRDVKNQCQSVQQCSSSNAEAGLRESAKDTLLALKAMETIERELKRLKGPRNRTVRLRRNRDKIQELEERKQSIHNLYPWILGKVFKDGYNSRDYASYSAESSEESKKILEDKMVGLIKDQLTQTREKLTERKEDLLKASSCIKGDESICEDLDIPKILAKAPPINHNEIFERDRKKELKAKLEEGSLTPEEKKEYRRLLTKVGEADALFELTQCLQTQRTSVKEVNKELALGALDVGIVIGTMGLGSAVMAGRIALRVGGALSKAQKMSKAKRLQNLGVFGTDVSFSSPYMKEALNVCEDVMNQLEETVASEETDDNQMCEKMPVRAKHTSDLKSCILQASLSSLPITLPLVGLSGIVFTKKIFKLRKKSKPPVIVLSGDPPKNALLLSTTDQNTRSSFRQAYNKGQFTEDEIYIDSISTRFGHPFFAKVISVQEGTVVADVVHHAGGRIERRKLSAYEVDQARVSLSSKNQFQNQLDKVDATVFPKSNAENALRTQGHRDIFADGVDDMRQLQAVGERLKEVNINPFRTHIVDFANKAEDHIKFIREGMIEAREELKDVYQREINKGGFDYLKRGIKNIDEQLKEDLKILEDFSQEARKKIKEEKVTYAWWLHWNNRLSVLATRKSGRTRVIDASNRIESPEDRADISRINDNWWKTEENLDEYLDGKYYSEDFRTGVDYVNEAIRDFPDRIHLPTIEPYGIIAMNESAGSHIFPSGLVAKDTIADGGLKAPDEFHLHDLNDSTNGFKKGGLILNRDFNVHFRREVESLSPEDREKVETIFFAIRENPGKIDDFNHETMSIAMRETAERFRNDKDLGALLPVHVDMRSEESVMTYLQESANVFISVSDRATRAINQ